MVKIKILDVVFENQIADFEVEAFRGAVSRLVGFENTLFHNHLSDNKLAYAYPLVQYSRTNKGQATFSCLARGVEEAIGFFHQKDWSFEMTGRKVQLKIDTFQLRNAVFDIREKKHLYTIHNWQPLNQENHKKFNSIRTAVEKIQFLEAILIGNILSMAKSLNWTVKDKIELSIMEVMDQKTKKFKKNDVLVFDLTFETNAFLPTQIGLGKGVSHGFGTIVKRQDIKP